MHASSVAVPSSEIRFSVATTIGLRSLLFLLIIMSISSWSSCRFSTNGSLSTTWLHLLEANQSLGNVNEHVRALLTKNEA